MWGSRGPDMNGQFLGLSISLFFPCESILGKRVLRRPAVPCVETSQKAGFGA